MKRLSSSDPTAIGPYRLFADLGEGGMGRVFLGASGDGRLLAIKQVRADLREVNGFRERFRVEVEASRKVPVNPYAAMIIDSDVDAKIPWLATEYMPGPTLHEVIDGDQGLPLDATLRVAADMAAALRKVHGVKVIHRDLKPSNIILTLDGAKLIDFGIARDVDNRQRLTRTRAVIGTPEFMSPEQAEAKSDITSASDIFSLGSVLFAAHTAKLPFDGPSDVNIMYAIAHGQADLAALPARLREIVAPCLEKTPGSRPTADRLIDLIGDVNDDCLPASVRRLIEQRFDAINSRLGDLPQSSTVRRGAVAAVTAMRGGATRIQPRTPAPPRPKSNAPDAKQAAMPEVKRRTLLVGGLTVLGIGVGVWYMNRTSVITVSSSAPVRAMTFDPDGKLITGNDSGDIEFWNMDSRKITGGFSGDTAVGSLSVSPDGTKLASVHDDGVLLWNTADGSQHAALDGGGPVTFSPEGTMIATTGGEARIWDTADGSLISTLEVIDDWGETNTYDARSLAFSPNGKHLVVCSAEEGLTLWKTDDFSLETTMGGLPAPQLEYSPDGVMLAGIGDYGGAAQTVWHRSIASKRGEMFCLDTEQVRVFACSFDSKMLATSGDSGLELWDVSFSDGYAISTSRADKLGGDSLAALAFSPNGNLLAGGGVDADVKVWTLE